MGSGELITNAQCPMPNAQCPMPNAQCPMPNAQKNALIYRFRVNNRDI
ncbi:hypothetical protein [Nostoc sp.]